MTQVSMSINAHEIMSYVCEVYGQTDAAAGTEHGPSGLPLLSRNQLWLLSPCHQDGLGAMEGKMA